MIHVALVAESQLDRGAFLVAASHITGVDHAKQTDRKTYRSVQAEDIDILSSFASRDTGDSITYLGFLIAGLANEIDILLERCPGMPYVNAHTGNPMARAVVVTGSVFQWGSVVSAYCNLGQTKYTREAFTQIYHILQQKGLNAAFDGFKRQDHRDGTILLLPGN